MLHINIRHGTEEDTILITGLIKNMVKEMALYGGHMVNDSPEVWSSMAEQVKENATHPEHIHLIASSGTPTQTTVGILVGNIEQSESIFVAKPRLHISAIYTVPTARGQGVAKRLIQKVLEWGQRMNASEAHLNVLMANPARRLYEHLGFQVDEISMVKSLNDDQIAGT